MEKVEVVSAGLGAGARVRKDGYAEEEEGVNGKGGFLSPYMGGQNYEPPTGLIKLAYLPTTAVNGAVGLPTPVLMRIPE